MDDEQIKEIVITDVILIKNHFFNVAEPLKTAWDQILLIVREFTTRSTEIVSFKVL